MNFSNLITTVLIALTTGSSLFAESVSDEMLLNLDTLQHTLQIHYAPAEWKDTEFGWNVAGELDKARQHIALLSNPTQKDFQGAVSKILRGTHDHHVGIIFTSTECCIFPIEVQKVNDRYFILPNSQLGSFWSELILKFIYGIRFDKGDELVAVNGIPIEQYMQEFLEQIAVPPFSPTDNRLAEQWVFARAGAMGHPVCDGTLQLMVKRKGQAEASVVNAHWLHIPETIPVQYRAGDQIKARVPNTGLLHRRFEAYFTKAKVDFQKRVKNHVKKLLPKNMLKLRDYDNSNNGSYEKKRQYYIDLGDVQWQAKDNAFSCHVAKTAKGVNVGFFKLETFSPDYEDHDEDYDWEVLEQLIPQLEEKSDALVIDLRDNPGGIALYMYGVASMLTDRPLAIPKHRLKLTSQDVFEAAEMLDELQSIDLEDPDEVEMTISDDDIYGYPSSAQFIRDLIAGCQFVLSQWQQGKSFTDPTYIDGVPVIAPHPRVRYTKPIVILTNELDFSCGDFFPAIMQDNKRALILGQKTAGAGGAVSMYTYPNRMGIAVMCYTTSFAVRPTGKPLENLGVTPDVLYTLTEKDLLDYNSDFAEVIVDTVHNLLTDKGEQEAS